jgi:hypothetical protein
MSRSCSDLEIPPCPKHTSVSQQQSASSSGARKCNIVMLQNSSPKGRPILGAVAAAHWENVHLAQSPPQLWDGKGEPNLSHKYKEVLFFCAQNLQHSWKFVIFEPLMVMVLGKKALDFCEKLNPKSILLATHSPFSLNVL